MNALATRSLEPSSGLWRCRQASAGFTLLEVMVASTILAIAVSMTFVVQIAALKRVQHTERTLKGTAELRYATDVISQAIRSAAQLPTTAAGGLQLFVPPKDQGFATVLETTWIDSQHQVKGSKSNQRMLHVSNVALPAVVASVWKSDARPASSIGSGDVSTYFVDGSNSPVIDLNDLFTSGDTIKIPATAFGPELKRVINNISNNPGNKTLTLTANLGYDVPNGTKIVPSSGRRSLFEVIATGRYKGDLRYYPDSRNTSRFFVLAHEISPAPLVDPADLASSTTVPFVVSPTDAKFVTLNLQKIPAGTRTGRTLQGVQTTVFTRTDPLVP